jgi:hypothetical protein
LEVLRSDRHGSSRPQIPLVVQKIRRPQEATRQIPALAKLGKESKMKTMWKQGRVSKDWFADYRGLSARVRVDPETGKATEIS